MNFLKSFSNFWGAVAAATASFPLGNNLFSVLPLIQHNGKLQTTLAMIFTVYALILAYTLRNWLPTKKIIISIWYALFSLIFFALYIYLIGQIAPFNSGRVAIEILAYVIFFFFITSAFATLAVTIYNDSCQQLGGDTNDL